MCHWYREEGEKEIKYKKVVEKKKENEKEAVCYFLISYLRGDFQSVTCEYMSEVEGLPSPSARNGVKDHMPN